MEHPIPLPTARPLRIFVVENHPDTLQLLSMYLEGLGHTVFLASTMAEALRKLPGADCEVLICDIGLPDGDGWQLLQKAALPRRVYAIAMSGFGMSTDHLRSKEVGYRRHLLKPFDPAELDQALAEAIQERAASA